MKIIFNTFGLIGSVFLIIYGLLIERYITGSQVAQFSHDNFYLLGGLAPLAAGIIYHLGRKFGPQTQTANNSGNDQINDLMAAAYGQKPSIQIEEQPIRRRPIQ